MIKVNFMGKLVLFAFFLMGLYLIFYYSSLSMYVFSSTIIGLTWIIGFLVTFFYKEVNHA